jgi:hypothetical protein
MYFLVLSASRYSLADTYRRLHNANQHRHPKAERVDRGEASQHRSGRSAHKESLRAYYLPSLQMRAQGLAIQRHRYIGRVETGPLAQAGQAVLTGGEIDGR